MAEVAAIFDVEGTLFTSCWILWWGILKNQAKDKRKVPRVVFHFLSQMVLAALYRSGVVDISRVRVNYGTGLARLLRGTRCQDIAELARQLAQKLLPHLRPDMQLVLEDHRGRGHRIVLVSSALQPFLEAIGQAVGAALCVGTGLEKVNAHYSGRLSTPVCLRHKRAQMLRDRFQELGLEIDLAASYAYGDRIWDAPVLEMVGNAVATYPDPELMAYAQRQGWRTIG